MAKFSAHGHKLATFEHTTRDDEFKATFTKYLHVMSDGTILEQSRAVYDEDRYMPRNTLRPTTVYTPKSRANTPSESLRKMRELCAREESGWKEIMVW